MDYSLLIGIHNVDLADGGTAEEDGDGGEPSTSKQVTDLFRMQPFRSWDIRTQRIWDD